MSRGLVLLIVAAAAASTQAAWSACTTALYEAREALKTAGSACLSQYSADIEKYVANPNCTSSDLWYGEDTCNAIVANAMKCIVKAVKLLKADNTFDDAAFKATTLKNKCSADAKFIAAYPKCRNHTMKYWRLDQLCNCLT
ncbi:uncharacterized protein LOC108681302 [Hyalella azteca]|uniref:Uncharacterized protein LOC108681302 n=1 Tax=Hyalella azteca TaxID=294128 RepID=A0A8B7PI34_HYAAZ|nr:uncharacterized protein LOC108681302 [Hyalella azteca]